MLVFADQRFGRPNLPVAQAVILRQFNRRLKPELRLPIRVMDVHMKPGFFAREEKEPEAVFAKNCRAHGLHFQKRMTFNLARLQTSVAVWGWASFDLHARYIVVRLDPPPVTSTHEYLQS